MEPSLSSPIQVKANWAIDCYASLGEKLSHDPEIVNLVKHLKKAISESRSAMSETGLSSICRQCEVEEGGSCCGAGLEDRYSAGLLLINLLLEATLPVARFDENSCYFLGKKGCLLKARHAICVNYICSKISHQLDPGLLGVLREKEGVELVALFRLNERIKTLLRQFG
jgi:hypothetical protein